MMRLVMAVLVFGAASCANGGERVVVGSKSFNEGYVLGEVVAQVLEHAGYDVERRFGLGGTLICYEALKHGEIDVYVEYTGTLAQAILKLDAAPSAQELNALLASDGVQLLAELGFDNT
jgi:osmoprotectant transport system permease protein